MDLVCFPWNLNEDLCTLIPKTLHEPKEISSISASLFDQFDIKPRKDRVEMALRSLESKGRINHNEGLFSLSCSSD